MDGVSNDGSRAHLEVTEERQGGLYKPLTSLEAPTNKGKQQRKDRDRVLEEKMRKSLVGGGSSSETTSPSRGGERGSGCGRRRRTTRTGKRSRPPAGQR